MSFLFYDLIIKLPFPCRIVNHLEVKLRCEKPSPEDLSLIIRESKVLSGGDHTRMYVKTKTGDLFIARDSCGCAIGFPQNKDNAYKLTFSKDVDKKVADWICKEWEHLSWADFHYTSPAEYTGNDPQTLDELCVFYRRLRMSDIWNQEVKSMVARRFLDFIFEEASTFAQKLNMPFHTLHLFSPPGRRLASTDCAGQITFNAHKLHQDADTIRQIIVHELCHSVIMGHGKRFSKAMEEAMLTLGLIPRPCAFSDKLCNFWGGVNFPTGSYCPGYDFEDTDSKDTPEHPYMDKTSLWRSAKFFQKKKIKFVID